MAKVLPQYMVVSY